MESAKVKGPFQMFAGLILAAALGCSRPSPAWNGTWKLNESKSSIPGPSFSVAISPQGEYHLDNGTYSYSFGCDGSQYPTIGSRTISCTQKGAFSMDTTSRESGREVASAHWELSDDEKMLTINGTTVRPDGSIKSIEHVYSRTSASVGFAGGWRDTKRLESRPPLQLTLSDRTLHVMFSDDGQYVDAPLDGSDAPMHGPGVPQDLTFAITPHGTRELLTTRKLRGQIINQGFLRLSADGLELVEAYWRSGRPDEKAVLVYERQ